MFVCPYVHLSDRLYACLLKECASVHSSVHPFVCTHKCFILACVRECLWFVCLSYSIFYPPIRSNRRTYKQSRGWSGGAKVLGKLPVPGRPTNLDYRRVRAYCACSRCRWGLFGHFFLSSTTSLFFLPLSGRRPNID